MGSDDTFSGIGYRRLISWRERIEREGPLLEAVLATAPERSVLDIGCGTGEHALHMARSGYRVVGVDRSESQIKAARDHEGACGAFGPRFLLGDVRELAELEPSRFGAALCVGNTLPSLEDDELAAAAATIHERLLPGAPWLIQILNYERIVTKRIRSLPVNIRPGDRAGEEIVFVRLMTPDPPHHVLFHPTVLRLVHGGEPPLEIMHTREARVRAWRWSELEALLRAQRFEIEATYGTMIGASFDAEESTDLVVIARRG